MRARTSTFHPDLGVWGVLGLALAVRLWRLDVPLVDAHSWRQVTNADIARHFATTTWNLFRPEVSWGGVNGVVGMEFPLLQWTTGLLWRLTGESEPLARLMTVVWSVAGVGALYALGRRLMGRPAGLAAAALMAVAPGTVFFGRAFLSDTPMLTCMIGAVWAWDVWFTQPAPWRLGRAIGLTALAALVKLPAILVLAPVAGVALRHRGWPAARDVRLWAAVLAAVAMAGGWYYHADRIYLDTGLTQAVFRPSGTYPPSIAPGVTFVSVSHWATAARVLSADTWLHLGDRFWQLHLTAFGAAGALLGAWLLPRPARWPVHLWTLAGVALVLAALEGQYWHEFHQLPLLPPLFLYFGAAAGPAFDATWRRRVLGGPAASALLAGVALLVALQAFRASGVQLHLYRPENLQHAFLDLGAEVRTATEPGRTVVTVDYDSGGANSPMLLYYAHRQGWSFDVHSVSVAVLERLAGEHRAGYFATPVWQALRDGRPEVAAWLERHAARLPLDPALGPDARLFDLQRR